MAFQCLSEVICRYACVCVCVVCIMLARGVCCHVNVWRDSSVQVCVCVCVRGVSGRAPNRGGINEDNMSHIFGSGAGDRKWSPACLGDCSPCSSVSLSCQPVCKTGRHWYMLSLITPHSPIHHLHTLTHTCTRTHTHTHTGVHAGLFIYSARCWVFVWW